MADRARSTRSSPSFGVHAEALDTSLSPERSLIAENVDPLRHASAPERLPDRGDATDTASRPTHTLEEIAEDATHGRFDKLKQAMFQVYPSERLYAQDLSQLVSEITSRMIRAVPDEMSGVNHEELVVHLVDSPTVNAFVTTTSSGAFDVYINRGLIAEFLSAPEFAEKDLRVDALAGVVAHEICHTNFERKYRGRANTMVQEEYCDLLPAKMLERIGLRPEAMSKLCDLFSRIGGRREAFAVSRDEPHASPAIRKEVYEKGAWHEYERDRRKPLIGGASSSIDQLREGWRDRLEAILEASQHDRVVTPMRYELERQGFSTADCDGKLEIIHRVMEEYRPLISDWSAGSLSRELAALTVEALGKAKGPVGRYSTHHLCVKLSSILYNQANERASVRSYQEICQALGVENFGAFVEADEKYLALVSARTKDEVIAALKGCEQLLSYDAQPDILRESWGGVLLPRTRDKVSALFSAAELEAVKQGRAIPFPFGTHRELREELLSAHDGERYQSAQRTLNVLAHFYKRSGLEFATECLRGQVGDESFSTIALNPARHLMRTTESGTLEAFDIDLERGISLRYPGRQQVTPEHGKGAVLESEVAFAEFIARRGAELLPEVARLDTRRAFIEFAFEHAHLIMPQVHPVGSLPEELTRRSHALARAMMERLEYLVTNDTTGEFTDTPVTFLTKFNPMSGAPFLDVYRDYHRSVVQFYDKGCRVDPKHPIVRALLDNVGGVLTPAQQIVGISALNGFNGDKRRITEDSLHTAFREAVGGEERLRSLLGVDLSRPPAQFIEGLVRISDGGPKLYTSEYVNPALPVFEVRARYIDQYLSQGSPERFTVAQLHTLYDLCSYDSAGLALGRRLRDLVTQMALNQDLTKLSNGEFLDLYQRIVAMGITDRNVSVERRWQDEVMRRYDTLSDVDARASFLAEISFPRPFSCGEKNRLGLLIGRYDTDRFKGISTITSAYLPKASDPRFERFTIDGLVDVRATQVRARSRTRFDDRTPEFLKQCENLLSSLDRRGLPQSIRSRVLREVADELLLQREASFLFRDNLTFHSKYQSQLTFANFMTATHQHGESTNAIVSEAHNRLVGLRDSSERPFRESLLRFFLNRRPDTELANLSAQLLKKLEGRNPDDEGNLPQIFKTMGMIGVQGFLSPEDGERQREIVEYHLRSLHERFLELDVKAKGAALSMIAVDTSPSEESFQRFKNEVLLPRILPEKGAYNELLVSAISDYFEFYGNALHHKYMVACAILASAQQERSEVSELANVGLVAKSFLGSHGTAGYKLLQRIRNHPTTPQEIKDVLHNVLDETVSLPRWTIHERIEELGPLGATEHWVGRAKAGSMCLSVPFRKSDGTESFLSIIHPGAQVDSLYWLQNFTTMASNLSQIKPELGVLAPMAQQTRRLIANETDFAQSPMIQQEIAERGYTYSMELPQYGVVIRSSCAPLISSEAKPHPSDFMKNSGNKEAARARGRTLLEMVAEFREKSGSGAWSTYQTERGFEILKAVAFSVIANEVRLAASGQGKDHDRHPGNYLVEVRRNHQRSMLNVELHHFDFGCADVEPPGAVVQKELGATIERVLNQSSLFTMLFRPREMVNRAMEALFEKGTYVPEVASIPLGFLAAMGANERVVVDNKERALLDGDTLAQACKVGLESAKVPRELRIDLPKGIKGWLLKRAYQRIQTQGTRFV